MPSEIVDVNSWISPACYPRGSFYPVSHGPSTRYRGITKPDFRLCSTCQSRSQAPLYLCALRLIANQAEGTIGLLRYSFGGDRPSQTAQLTLSSARFHGSELESKLFQGGISTSANQKLAPLDHRLPPILHRTSLDPISAYSEGSWGLSV